LAQTIGMEPQDAATRNKFENELNRIIDASRADSVPLRVLGSLAFQLHCPQFGHLQARMGRAYTDIDFAAYGAQARAVSKLLGGLGYAEDSLMFVETEGSRAIFEHRGNGLHVDVFYNKLDFCHVIRWDGRLEADAQTIPLAELLLEKMQIVKINEKDVIDTIMLLLEHPLAEGGDEETINAGRVAKLCADDWGLWRTTTMNLDKVRRLAQNYATLSAAEKARVSAQVDSALARISAEAKPLAWRIRDRVGDRVKWYKDVDEVK
jgi:hypothetical protein